MPEHAPSPRGKTGRGKTRRGDRLGPPVPYLEGTLRADFDAWLAATVARHSVDLEFRELRKGAQALSWLYVERRAEGDLAARAVDGRGKRAALASYYAPLHFLATQHALLRIAAAAPVAPVPQPGSITRRSAPKRAGPMRSSACCAARK